MGGYYINPDTDGYYINPDDWAWEDDDPILDPSYIDNKKCRHKWKSTKLIVTTVFDCEICGCKKELEDKE